MKWEVKFKDLEDKPVEVEAVDRWEAVVKAVEALGLNKVPTEAKSYSTWSSLAVVRKLERKKRLSYWEKIQREAEETKKFIEKRKGKGKVKKDE